MTLSDAHSGEPSRSQAGTSQKPPSTMPDLVVQVVDSGLGRCLGFADETEREAYLSEALCRLLRAIGEIHDEHDHDAGRGVQRALREVLRTSVGTPEAESGSGRYEV